MISTRTVRPGQIKARAVGHEQLVTQDGQIPPAGHTVAHDRGDLSQSRGRKHRVVAENAAEIILVGEDVLGPPELDALEGARARQRGLEPIGIQHDGRWVATVLTDAEHVHILNCAHLFSHDFA